MTTFSKLSYILSKARIAIEILLILGCLCGNYIYYNYYMICGDINSKNHILILLCVLSEDLISIIIVLFLLYKCLYKTKTDYIEPESQKIDRQSIDISENISNYSPHYVIKTRNSSQLMDITIIK